MARRRQPSSGRIEASNRAVAILDALADAGEIGTNELARRTGLPASTVSRQLGTLAATGLVEQDAESGRYRLGIHVVRLGGTPAGPLAALVRTLLLCLVIPAVIFDPDQRGLHDKAAKTVLVRM